VHQTFQKQTRQAVGKLCFRVHHNPGTCNWLVGFGNN